MKRYFLGLAANYDAEDRRAQLFSLGRDEDRTDLAKFLERKYDGKAILTKNGRSALALALKAYFKEGDRIIVNGFTCFAVYEAVKEVGLVPVFADITRKDLNFSIETLEKVLKMSEEKPRGIIIQNTFGNPVDIEAIEKFAKENDLVIIEDLAHATGVRYPDGREVGTVGVATALSFGKEKSIDTISGGAVILRHPCLNEIEAPSKAPKLSDHLRARFYPTFGAACRALSHIHLGGVLMKILIKIHWVERSADNKLDCERKISKFEARLALRQIKSLKRSGEVPLREFYLVKERDLVLKKLAEKGYYFGGFWYEKPVSPERYYKKVHFPEKECPNAVFISEHIINFPNYYTRRILEPARKIVQDYLIKEGE
ncbi:aminotransferase class I/II-fold pyridoxal phosphate-dependent enzyme [Candidatus Saccharibacteria bacterium]|nr:aminotransferase class I/II-fold pyridoxal phosphate-dependent enzyme [Candidatus Saccharibacteria bacterium]